jgi:hypothetical protein
VKRLVVCADGTWNSHDAPHFNGRGRGLTNVAKLANAIAVHDDAGILQEVHYDPGVGTYRWWDRLSTSFGATIAHGYLTLSLLPLLSRDRQGVSSASYSPPTSIQTISLRASVYEQNTAPTGSGTQIAAFTTSRMSELQATLPNNSLFIFSKSFINF